MISSSSWIFSSEKASKFSFYYPIRYYTVISPLQIFFSFHINNLDAVDKHKENKVFL
jgi:hypothetical protein